MADLLMGAMGSLVRKLGELLKEEYNLQAGMKERIRSLTLELEGAQAALRKVAQVPWDQLDEQVKLWAREVRESSYDMEDVLDTFLVRVQGRDSTKQKGSFKLLGEMVANLFKKSTARREISVGVKDIMAHLDEVTKRWCRYKVGDIVAKPATATTIDPRLSAMYNKVKDLVGIDKSSGELISKLQAQQQGDEPNTKMKIVSVVGVGGLGKTTLSKAVYEKLKGDFECKAFVPVGRNPDLMKVIKMILIGLDKERYLQFNFAQYDEIHQFIDELRNYLLENKRYIIVIDDIWEVQSWETIKMAIDDDNNCGGRIIVTTRKLEVARKAGEVYMLQPLSCESSVELFFSRMSGDQGSSFHCQPDEMSNKILKRCGGIPLAIITMASLLVGKPRDKWFEIYKSIGFGHKDSNEAENTTMKILSFSYYDLPLHLRTCLLYVSAFPEDSTIHKYALIWKWIAEGFVHEEKGRRLFEIGEGYFNDLINRSLIQVVEDEYHRDMDICCRVHDIVLDFICQISQEENFFTILDCDKGTPPSKSKVRRLAQHNRTLGPTHQASPFSDMQTVRSFIAQGCAIQSWVPQSSFKLLRVLAIEHCNRTGGCRIDLEHVGHLLYLRYLSLRGTSIDKIPEKIGALRFLQTLDLFNSYVTELPSSSSLPTQLVCLRISFGGGAADTNVAWLKRLTSLEELVLENTMRPMTELGSLRELRVLKAWIDNEEESERDFVESVSQLDKLQHLEIGYSHDFTCKAAGLVLPHQLQYLVFDNIVLLKLPPCINPSNLPNLSHLALTLQDVDEQDLKSLGRLPELYFLCLVNEGWSAAVISNINDSNACYFPKLRCFNLYGAMVLLLASKEGKNVSFHLWDGYSDIALPSDSEDMLKIPVPSAAPNDENKDGSAFGKGAAATCHFMPGLQELEFTVSGKAAADPRYCEHLGWEYFASLREVKVDIMVKPKDDASRAVKVEAALRRAASEHPNSPALDIHIW